MGDTIRLEKLAKRFGAVRAVDGLDLEIRGGEFFTLLGASGCGKTTTLRLIGGLEKPDAGAVYVGDRCLAAPADRVFVPPEKRNMGMVFQSYALWPHMTVYENVAYPLSLRWVARAEIRRRVNEALALVGLAGLEDRAIPALSGGQQQRVALARALVFSPGVLLLDEPLSNLDAQLREDMRRELHALQRRLGLTVVLVTHDQIEALSLSDRLAIMRSGRIDQVGTPDEVYHRPATPFVRDFLGKVLAFDVDILRATADGIEAAPVGLPGTRLTLGRDQDRRHGANGAAVLAIRPEQIRASGHPPAAAGNVLAVRIIDRRFLGDRNEYTITFAGAERTLALPAHQTFSAEQEIFLELPPDMLTAWDAGDRRP